MPDATRKVPLCHSLLALALLLSLPAPAGAQTRPCDKHLKPVPGGVGYAWRAQGRRCEGLYQSTVSAVRLQLVSLLRGRLAFDAAKDDSLKVTAPAVPGLAEHPVHVRAVALPIKTYYRMDALLPPDGSLQWPVQDIIGRINLPASEIGVYGWVEDDDGLLFVPLSVTAEDDAADDIAASSVRVIVRSAVDLERLVWRTATEDGKVLDQQEHPEAPLRAGRPIALTLAAGATAVLQLDIAGLPSQSDRWTKLRIRVLRPNG